jgi:hypothetical protein
MVWFNGGAFIFGSHARDAARPDSNDKNDNLRGFHTLTSR